MKLNSYIDFGDLIDYERQRSDEERYQSDSYCIYWLDDIDNSPGVNDKVYIGPYPEITDDDAEIFPEEVLERDLWLCYRDELIQDVIDNAVFQKSSVSNDEIVHAIRYYSSVDNFWDFK